MNALIIDADCNIKASLKLLVELEMVKQVFFVEIRYNVQKDECTYYKEIV